MTSTGDLSGRTIAIVTANLGGIDNIEPFNHKDHYDGFYYTDTKSVKSTDKITLDSWSKIITPDYPRIDFNARLRAKYFKLQIHKLDEVESHSYLCWIDGRVTIKDPSFIVNAVSHLRNLPENQRVMMFANPFRKTVEEEYEFVMQKVIEGDAKICARYSNEPMREQIDYYKSKGFRLDAPLPSAGFWIRENSNLLNQSWDAWWDHNIRFSIMDQLSLPIVLMRAGIVPQIIPGNIYRNDFIRVGHHATNI